jgi:transcriptional regulator with XRE-family HTH domain
MAVADTFDKLIGERIRARRTELGLTQEQLAAGLGVSYQQIQKYESGVSRIAASRLVALAARLEAPITFFLGGASGGQGSESGPRQRTALELARRFAQIESEPVRTAMASLVRAVTERALPG